MTEGHEFEQRLIEGVGDQIAEIATGHFRVLLAREDDVVLRSATSPT